MHTKFYPIFFRLKIQREQPFLLSKHHFSELNNSTERINQIKKTNKQTLPNKRKIRSISRNERCKSGILSFFLFPFFSFLHEKLKKLGNSFWKNDSSKDDFGGGENTSSTSKSNKQFREFLTNASSEIFVRLFALFLLIIASKYFRYKSGRLGGGLTVGGWGASIINDWLYSARKLHFARAFCCVWARVNARIEPERIISPDCAYTLPYSSISDSFFILSSFFPFSTSVLFKNIPRLKSNEFIFSNWRRKADIGFIISLFPFYSPYIRFDSFRICFRLFFFISR